MMHLLRPKLKNGWMSVTFAQDRMDFAHVIRHEGKKPAVLLLDSFRRADGDLEVLRRLCKELKLGHYHCTHMLRVGEYQVLQVEPPEIPAEELKEALRWRIKEMINYPVEAATIDVLNIPSESVAAGRTKQAFVVAASNALLEPRIALFDEAKVNLEAIDIPELAQRNVAALFEEHERGLAMLVFDDYGVMLTFTFRGELHATRHTDIPLAQLEQAEEPRREQLFERIALDAQRSLDNFDRLNSNITVTRLLVSPLPGVPGFLEYLREYLSLPVVEIDLAEVFDFSATPELAEAVSQTKCLKLLGVALRE